MSKVDIKRLDSVTKNDTTATEQINDNFKALQVAIENTVSRDGTVPNYMDADLDLNSYRIINAGDPVGDQDVVTLKYFEERAGGAVEAAAEAKASASKAASSAQSALVASNNAIGQLAQAEGLLTAAEGQLKDTKQYVDTAKTDIENTKNTAIGTINSTVSTAKSDINTAVDEATMNISNTVDTGISSITDVKDSAINTINTSVSTAESNISTIVSDAEGSITSIAVTEANKAIANAAQEATDTATANLNSYVDGTVKPSLQTYVDQAQADANSAATSMEQAALSATAASNYASNASADAGNAAESAGLAANSAAAAATSKTNAKIWAEGTDSEVTALGGVHSSKVWSETAQAVVTGKQDIATAVNYKNITNCITEIPQDIKLELNDGTLTLKAGSTYYKCDGSFTKVTTSQDYSGTNVSNGYRLLFFTGNGFDMPTVQLCNSGTSEPTTGNKWFNTSNKILYSGGPGNWQQKTNFSLPLAVITVSDGRITSIDQVFNGFGYIGSTVFALPGVKGLIPNGRNADGSLKNIEFTTSKVCIVTDTHVRNNQDFVLTATTIGARSKESYLEDENLLYNGVTGKTESVCIAGKFSKTDNHFTELKPKLPFRAVDWNDIEDKLNHLNNPFFFGMHIWSDTSIPNASWLISNGSYHSGATYVDFYQWLLKIHNGTLTVDGVSVKAYGASGITDYDYVINTADTTFRLPVKVKLASGNRVAGNGMTLGLTDGTANYGLANYNYGNYGGGLNASNKDYGKSVGNDSTFKMGTVDKSYGITTDPTKSGIETSSQGLKLYFYVGETVQDANVIAASNALTDIANLKAHSIVETYVNGTSWYRVYSDGWCEQGGYIPTQTRNDNYPVTLLKPYKDTNYSLITNKQILTNVTNYIGAYSFWTKNKTVSGFTTAVDPNVCCYWQACGYIR